MSELYDIPPLSMPLLQSQDLVSEGFILTALTSPSGIISQMVFARSDRSVCKSPLSYIHVARLSLSLWSVE